LQVNPAGDETVVGTYQLNPGARVDVSVGEAAPGGDGDVRVEAIQGSVTVTVGGATQTLGEGESGTLPIDVTPPAWACEPAEDVWHTDNVSIKCVAADGVSGLVNGADASFLLTTAVALNEETANAQTNQRQVCDHAGNCAAAGPIGGIRIDRKSPAITIDTPIAATYQLNTLVKASYTCSDSGAGVASCTAPVPLGAAIDTSTPGTHLFTVTARDAVGLAETASVTYTVVVPDQPGQMNGNGEVTAAGVAHHFMFQAASRQGAQSGELKYWFEEHAGGQKGSRKQQFDSMHVSSVTFTDDLVDRPGHPNGPLADTVVFSGTGRWNGQSGYTFEARAVDAGEPGRRRDQMNITVRDRKGVIVASFAGKLDSGNIQSTVAKSPQ
jgi:hypothetical protein